MGQEAQGRAMLGVALVVVATLLFAISDVLTKRLATAYGITLVAAVRYLVNAGLLAAIWGPSQGRGLVRTQRLGLVALRGLCLAGATVTMGLALKVMPVGETVAIVYLAPIAVMVLAWLLLGETVRRAGWAGAALGFLGVLLIVRPGTGLSPSGVALSLANAGMATAYHLLTRVLSRTEKTMTLLFHTSILGTVLFGGLLVASPPTVLPGWPDLALMGLLGALALGGHYFFTAAYREAPVAFLAPVNYMHLAWAGLLGWLVFGHLPDALTGIGMALVVLAGLAVALQSRQQPAAPPVEAD